MVGLLKTSMEKADKVEVLFPNHKKTKYILNNYSDLTIFSRFFFFGFISSEVGQWSEPITEVRCSHCKIFGPDAGVFQLVRK